MRFILLVNLVLLATLVQAQTIDKLENNYIYLDGALLTGNYHGARLSFNYIHKDKYTVEIGYSALIRKAKSTPQGYSLGVFDMITLGSAAGFDQISSYEGLVGKIKSLNKKGTIRLNLKGGLAYSIIKQPTKWQPLTTYPVILPITANYTFEYQQKHVIGLVIHPAIEFPLTRYFGLSLSSFTNINKQDIAVGVGLQVMVGLLRRND